MSDDELRMDAYYYGFDPTGERCVDRVLSAVACAGKAFHHTEMWGDVSCCTYPTFDGAQSPVQWIEGAAREAADEIARLRTDVARLTAERDEARKKARIFIEENELARERTNAVATAANAREARLRAERDAAIRERDEAQANARMFARAADTEKADRVAMRAARDAALSRAEMAEERAMTAEGGLAHANIACALAEAERDAMRPVVEAADVWSRDAFAGGQLKAAVNQWRATTKERG